MKIIDNPYVRYPSPWDSYVTLPLSVPVSEWLARTRVTPNQITILSFCIALVAAWTYTLGSYSGLLTGGILYQLSYIFDCVDGYIARKNKLSSDFGYWLDHILDELKLLILVSCLVYGQIQYGIVPGTSETELWILALVYVYTRVFAKGDLLIKSTIQLEKERKQPTVFNVPGQPEDHEQLERPHGMVLTPSQLRMYRRLKIVTPFSVIESQGIAFCLGPIFGIPMIGLGVATALAVIWHGLMDVLRYWRKQAN